MLTMYQLIDWHGKLLRIFKKNGQKHTRLVETTMCMHEAVLFSALAVQYVTDDVALH